jgi:hypothetical protein
MIELADPLGQAHAAQEIVDYVAHRGPSSMRVCGRAVIYDRAGRLAIRR